MNSLCSLNAAQASQFRKARRGGYEGTREEWMLSKLQGDQGQLCLGRALHKHEVKADKKFRQRKIYLRDRVRTMESRVEETTALLDRTRIALLGNANALLYNDQSEGTGTDIEGESAREAREIEGEASTNSKSQRDRLLRQAFAVREVLRQERDRDAQQLAHLKRARDSAEECPRTPAAQKAAKAVVDEELYAAEVVRANHHIMSIAEGVSKEMESQIKACTISSWHRQFRQLGGYFKRDTRGTHARSSTTST